jgi:hypothetical protein
MALVESSVPLALAVGCQSVRLSPVAKCNHQVHRTVLITLYLMLGA